MRNKITLLDGATGTHLWKKAAERGVEACPVWKYNLELPEIVKELELEYLEAGSRIIYTNTFEANAHAIGRASSYTVKDVVTAAVKLAKEAVQEFRARTGETAQVALDIGPLPMMLEPFGDLTEEAATAMFEEMLAAGMAEGADLIVLETFLDLEMLKLAAQAAVSYGVPVFACMTFDKGGRTIMGNSPADIAEAMEELGASAVGMNCSIGPDAAYPVIKAFSEATDLPLVFKPNAGLATSGNTFTAETFAAAVEPALPLVTYLGSCCGSGPDFIAKMQESISRMA